MDAAGFEASEEDYADLIRETFSRSGEDLSTFSDAQVNQGVWYLASPSCSSFIFSLRDGDVPTHKKVAGILSIYELYRDCFAKRCTETLGHTDEPGASDLNAICYMFWDLCPLLWLDKTKDEQLLEDAVFSVLENTIRLPHRACIEGGLHGLAHISYRNVSRVKHVVSIFLRTTRLDETLREYAECARVGYVL
jgi:hypothetical protein